MNKGLLALFLVCLSITSLTVFEVVMAIPATSRNSTIEPGSMSEAYCSHLFFIDTNWFAKNCRTGVLEYTDTTLSSLLNTVITVDAAAGGGIEFVQNSGTIALAQWGTTKITLKATVEVDFEAGASYNINTAGDVFAGTDASGEYRLYLNSVFFIYGAVTRFIHLTNPKQSEIYIDHIGSGTGTIIAGTKAIYIDGNPAYYNRITISDCFTIDICIHLPFVTVGANANTIPYIWCQDVNYCVKIDASVTDTHIQRLIIGASGVTTGGTNAALYIGGVSNVADYVYGEYSNAGHVAPLVYLDTTATKNLIQQVLQEGTGGLFTDSSTVHSSMVKRFPVPASGAVTAGASVYTYTNNDAMNEQLILSTVNGISAETCNGVASYPIILGSNCLLSPGLTMVVTWAGSAPVYTRVFMP